MKEIGDERNRNDSTHYHNHVADADESGYDLESLTATASLERALHFTPVVYTCGTEKARCRRHGIDR
jgi:hypothetical protein